MEALFEYRSEQEGNGVWDIVGRRVVDEDGVQMESLWLSLEEEDVVDAFPDLKRRNEEQTSGKEERRGKREEGNGSSGKDGRERIVWQYLARDHERKE